MNWILLSLIEHTLAQFTQQQTAALEQIRQHFVEMLKETKDIRCIAVAADAAGYQVVTFLEGWDIETERAIYRAEYDFLRAVEGPLIDFVLIPNANEETLVSRTSEMTVLYSRR